ncbi:MAG TPA: homoserine dehydrogenase [Bacillota bacterium]|nr:homoserine dehydrogenase [Bacillota bacterium]
MTFIGVLGHGIVGSGVVELLIKNKESIAKRASGELVVKRILDIKDFPELAYSDLFTKDPQEIINDPEISIVVEVMGGIDPAYGLTKKALEAGKFVVSSNKELVAEHGAELQDIAERNKVEYLYEASVGGGIPIIRPLKHCLAGNNITEITGILNGTTNYILSEMKNKGKDFSEALSDAQANGYAERDPSSDIDGIDAQRKIAILCSIAFEQQVRANHISTQGISKISREDIIYAAELGYVIKLVAHAQKFEEGISAIVSPLMLPINHPLADVEDVFNAILVKGDAIGDVMFYGRGAGKFPTASAVVGDIIEAAKHPESSHNVVANSEVCATLLDTQQLVYKYYMRIKVEDVEEFKKEAGSFLAEEAVYVSKEDHLSGQVVVLTQPIIESDLSNIEDRVSKLDSVGGILNVIRISL